jgi:hypothetical protein
MISRYNEKYLIRVISMIVINAVSVESGQERYAASCTQEVTYAYSYCPHRMLLMVCLRNLEF